ncbi:hypothetical protein BDN67DRAFT_976744 [Paxillus ammoniavirescens]|nr:hypothetical protein BDN67DRAFT_976744 [Paxillus ammoniavirescens]
MPAPTVFKALCAPQPARPSWEWISWYLSSKCNEYFCEVEDSEGYTLDRFHLTGPNKRVFSYY